MGNVRLFENLIFETTETGRDVQHYEDFLHEFIDFLKKW